MQSLKKAPNLYILFVSIFGSLSFLYFSDFQSITTFNISILCVLVVANLILNYFLIPVPPNGNYLSMDSVIYLTSIFLFGTHFALYALLFHSIMNTILLYRTKWWKHIFNFSNYTLMIVISDFVFTFSGGKTGAINPSHLVPYILSLTVYFLINSALIGIYFLLTERESLYVLLKELIKDKTFIFSYINIFLLTFVLSILLENVGFFGLILFVCIALLLSIAFTQHFEQYQEISAKANKDFLTGLNNHGYFKELLEKAVKDFKNSDEPLCVGIIDIDDFKKYNDIYGHIQGDHLLQEFGNLLKTETEAKNYTVARYGGEEFSFMMPNTNRNQAFAFLDDLRKKTNDTYINGVEGLPYGCLSFSAGIAECEKETYSISELLNKADQALYAAKNHGKNLVKIFNSLLDYGVKKSLSLEKELDEVEQQLKIFLSKDVYTYRHSKRVYQYAVDFSRQLTLSEHERKTLILGALVHDIGKIEIPRDILNKKGKLDPVEWDIMKKHVTWGKEIISTNKKLEEVIPLVELHHERFDGRGYPYGLKGKTIPKLSRILSVVDSFDAMTTERPYQKTKTFTEAIAELRACSGKQFDPQYVEPFIEMIEKLDNVVECEAETAVHS
jgi:diguanylate cyclase (GGDEF)-like protein/putative nucleotidyltransferase with HDIG domain